jgi:hypothetical protein
MICCLMPTSLYPLVVRNLLQDEREYNALTLPLRLDVIFHQMKHRRQLEINPPPLPRIMLLRTYYRHWEWRFALLLVFSSLPDGLVSVASCNVATRSIVIAEFMFFVWRCRCLCDTLLTLFSTTRSQPARPSPHPLKPPSLTTTTWQCSRSLLEVPPQHLHQLRPQSPLSLYQPRNLLRQPPSLYKSPHLHPNQHALLSTNWRRSLWTFKQPRLP